MIMEKERRGNGLLVPFLTDQERKRTSLHVVTLPTSTLEALRPLTRGHHCFPVFPPSADMLLTLSVPLKVGTVFFLFKKIEAPLATKCH